MPTPILIIIAILVLSLLILIHEFGHFIAGRLIGVWVEEFGIGLPPRLRGKKIGETIYSINALPLGGFVRLHGETPGEKVKYPKRSFRNKSKFARAFVALAGIFMNIVFAVICLTLTFWILGIDRGAVIVGVAEGTPAYGVGFEEGDKVLKVDDIAIDRSVDFSRSIEDRAGKDVNILVSREGVEKTYAVKVNSEYTEDQGFTGIMYEPQEIYTPKLWQKPFVYTQYGVKETYHWLSKTVIGFATLFRQVSGGHVPQGIAGPFGVTLTIAEIFKYGIVNALTFTAIISINLAVINLLPFPPLDGSRVVLLGVEAVVGQKHLSKVEMRILEIGMAIMLLLILVLTISEIPRLISAGSVSAFVDSLFGS